MKKPAGAGDCRSVSAICREFFNFSQILAITSRSSRCAPSSVVSRASYRSVILYSGQLSPTSSAIFFTLAARRVYEVIRMSFSCTRERTYVVSKMLIYALSLSRIDPALPSDLSAKAQSRNHGHRADQAGANHVHRRRLSGARRSAVVQGILECVPSISRVRCLLFCCHWSR